MSSPFSNRIPGATRFILVNHAHMQVVPPVIFRALGAKLAEWLDLGDHISIVPQDDLDDQAEAERLGITLAIYRTLDLILFRGKGGINFLP